jgi:hypothetical protein
MSGSGGSGGRRRAGGPAALSLASGALDALAALAPDPALPDPHAVAEAAEERLGVPVRVEAVAALLAWQGRLF